MPSMPAEYFREWRKNNPERARAITKKYRKTHARPKEQKARHDRDYRQRHWPELLRKKDEYRKRHPDRHCANQGKRRALKTRRTPAWADHAKIRAVYAEARRLTLETGVPHEVDHVVPLLGVLVSGLHVHENLQVLTEAANIAKSNNFEV